MKFRPHNFTIGDINVGDILTFGKDPKQWRVKSLTIESDVIVNFEISPLENKCQNLSVSQNAI